MKKTLFILLILSTLLFAMPVMAANKSYSGFPTFSITAVVSDDTVTILGHNFPANDDFTVTMGAMVTGDWRYCGGDH
jgi:type 1 fimbria pilin